MKVIQLSIMDHMNRVPFNNIKTRQSSFSQEELAVTETMIGWSTTKTCQIGYSGNTKCVDGPSGHAGSDLEAAEARAGVGEWGSHFEIADDLLLEWE